MTSCTIQRLDRPGLSYIKIAGTIDESLPIDELVSDLRGDAIVNLGRVTRYSSFGVRQWMSAMTRMRSKSKQCVLVECSPAVINQLNTVADFAKGTHVKTVRLPFVCLGCAADTTVTVDVDAQRDDLLGGKLPSRDCAQCHKPMVFDDDPTVYFAFLKEAAPPPAGSPLAAFIALFETASPGLDDAADLTIQFDASDAQILPVPRSSAPKAPRLSPAAPPRPSGPVLAAPSPRRPSSASTPGKPWESTPSPPAPVSVPPPGGAARDPDAGDTTRPAIVMVGESTGSEITRPALVVTDALFAFRRRWLAPVAVAACVGAVLGAVAFSLSSPARAPNPEQSRRRQLNGDEIMKINGLLAKERFTEADALVRRTAPELDDESAIKLLSLVRSEKQDALDRHIARAKVAAADKQHFERAAELTLAIEIGGSNPELEESVVRAYVEAGDCAAAAKAVIAFTEERSMSSATARLNALKNSCTAAPKGPAAPEPAPQKVAEVAPPRPAARPDPAPAPARPAPSRPERAQARPAPAPAPARPPPEPPAAPAPALNNSEIGSVVSARRGDLMSCKRAHTPGGRGALDFTWTVLPTGKVTSISCTPADFCGAPFGECIRGVFTTLEFPAAATRPNQVVNFPVRF